MDHPHYGHRERLRSKFLKYGSEGLEEHELLELLLFYTNAQQDMNPLAHRLIDTFGSLRRVLSADVAELADVPGMSMRKAMLIKTATEVGRKFYDEEEKKLSLANVGEASAYIVRQLYDLSVEELHIFCLDMKLRLIGHKRISTGSLESVSVDKRAVVSAALSMNAAYLILAHNHPGGSPRPSRADILLTKELADILAPVGVGICDHIITANDEFYSFSRKGEFSARADSSMLVLEQYHGG